MRCSNRSDVKRGGPTMTRLTRILPLLCVAAASAMPAQAQELKIGFLAPRTGIITQLGTDMINGFQMYLDERDGKLGGAKVTFIIEDGKSPKFFAADSITLSH